MHVLSLNSGDQIPGLGLGTWKSAPGTVAAAVKEAIGCGYRHIDCAPIYGNEAEVGQALGEVLQAGQVSRNDLWITSKLWNNAHAPELVEPALRKTLADLQLEYLDLFLIHWPVAFAPGVLFAQKPEEFIPLADQPIIETWGALETCKEKGLVRNIGVCNFSQDKLITLCDLARVQPAMNQIELHPYLQQEEMVALCAERSILLTAYSPLGSGDRPKAMKKQEEPILLDNPTITEIAAQNKITPAQVLLAWGLTRGTVVIPKSTNPERIRENLAASEIRLDAQSMEAIARIDLGFRYVDGAFFCGKGSPYSLDFLWGNK
ncbi:aldo/keto reductase [Desulfobulbus rhabdoformis]|jgi:alcohol dehydrogenase (NADP+)|uniref:aldo/keto reductase n=1 Tax=Desulfobulbus rhabdoformis TaxID=34032 RepID=UPI0019626906|nr:aldo/keto reductase [Desulfobulbus rhabdoformis]MBM9615062.1 aldo/keto reductase [Desulfobulbus rhabdoformis]